MSGDGPHSPRPSQDNLGHGLNSKGLDRLPSENYISAGVLEFTLIQATCSTILTSMVALPVAWVLGRYRWPFEPWIRAVLTLPFVVPSIIAAMGVLTLVGVHGANIRPMREHGSGRS